jgi:hypothetical protein
MADGNATPEPADSSVITQVSAVQLAAPASAPDSSPPPPPPPPPPPRRGFVAALLRCCGRVPEAESPGHRPQSSRTLYIPPAPHVGAPFIPPLLEGDTGKKTLVLDLDETLVHSSFKPVPNPDYVIPVEIDGKARAQPPLARSTKHKSAPTRSTACGLGHHSGWQPALARTHRGRLRATARRR